MSFLGKKNRIPSPREKEKNLKKVRFLLSNFVNINF